VKILTADDDDDVREILTKLLTDAGHEVTPCTDGHAAWEAFKAADYSMGIFDWRMPRIDGLELTGMIRSLARASYCHILILTAQGREGYAQCLDAGADDFMRKPFQSAELLARIRVAERMVRVHSQMAQLEGLLSMCAYCRGIRNDENQWVPVEKFLASRTKTTVSHGVCPRCKDRLLAERKGA
jgi:phosphoserine phosphatase RsbU/P